MKYINDEIKSSLDISEERTGKMENKIENIQTRSTQTKTIEKYRKKHNRCVKYMKMFRIYITRTSKEGRKNEQRQYITR